MPYNNFLLVSTLLPAVWLNGNILVCITVGENIFWSFST